MGRSRYPEPLTTRSKTVMGLTLAALLLGGTVSAVLTLQYVLAERTTATVVDVRDGSCGGGRYSPSYECWLPVVEYVADGKRKVGPAQGGPTSAVASDPAGRELIGETFPVFVPGGRAVATDEPIYSAVFAVALLVPAALLGRAMYRRVPAVQTRERARRKAEGIRKRRETLARKRAAGSPAAPSDVS